MSRYIILFDRNSLVGVARKTRRTGWELTTDPLRGHPMISRNSPITADYFRKSAALYYSWDNGTGPGNYSHLRILNGDGRRGDLDQLSSISETVGINITNQGDLQSSILLQPAATVLQIVWGSFSDEPLSQWGDPGGPLESIFLGSAFAAWGENIVVKIEGDNGAWVGRSNYAGVSGVLRELFNEPYWSNWQAYVLGGSRLGDNDETEQDLEGGVINRSGIPGLFGEDMIDRPYLDHNTSINLMSPENISTSATYGYYSAFFDQLKNNANVKEVYIPNFYLVSSILSTTDGYSYKTLYNNYNQETAPVAPSGQSINKVKQLLSDAIAPAHPNGTDVLDTAAALTINNIQVSPQTPDSLLSRFARKDFTDAASLVAVENANKHIGLTAQMVKAREITQTSMVSEMNVQDKVYPCSINIQFSSPDARSAEEPEIVGSLNVDAPGMSETFYNFILYEVMKANILNYENISSGESSTTQPTLGPDPLNQATSTWSWLYEEIPFSAKIIDDTDIRYKGIDWTGNGPWADESPGNSARSGYSLRTIDFTNMFRNIYQQQLSNYYGSGSNYNGFVGQTTEHNVVDGKGIIVGQRYKALAPVEDWARWDATDFHNAGFGAVDGYGSHVDASSVHGFYTDLAGFTNEKMRSVYEVLSHNYAPREPLVFKIDKHEVLANGTVVLEPIQSIYIPKTGDVVNYKDTQVFAGKRYKYKFYSYNLVEGNSYSYTNPQVYPMIQEPYPSQLGHRLGFYTDSKPGGINVDSTWNPLGSSNPPKNVYVGKLLSYRLKQKDSALMRILSNPSSEYVYWDPANRYYVDVHAFSSTVIGYSAGAAEGEMESQILARTFVDGAGVQTPPLNLGPPGTIDDGFAPSGFVKDIEDALNGPFPGTPWKVRFFTAAGSSPSVGDLGQGRFVITRKEALTNPEFGTGLFDALGWSAEYEALGLCADNCADPESQGGGLISNYLELFGLASAYAVGPVNPAAGLHYKLMFETGPHGSNPTIPWNENEAQDPGTAKVTVKNRKSLKIVELQIGETNPVAVTDLPPQFPNVDIFPIRGVNNKIKILLNESNHTDSYAPIIINASDEQIFEDIRIAQGRDVGGALLFGSDDSKIHFEIYRIETEPTSYTDFSGHRIHNLDTVTPSGISIESASTVDIIQPNTVYYYCFRAVDKNGYMSNPSPVLRVQMIDDNGRIYPIIEPYTVAPKEIRKTEKSFKRYIEIDTSLEEKNINLGSPPDLTSAGSLLFPPTVDMGNIIWDSETTFKVRIISKDTGRKLDLNIDFDIEPIPNPKLQGN